jgi:phosphate transport system protein
MKKFDSELADLQRRMSDMGDLAHSMVRLIAEAIKDRCKDVHGEVMALESRVNRLQMDIDHDAIRMLTIYGPVATDLRQILVCTHVTSQFERMGDQCVNICQAMHLMRSEPASHPMLPHLRKMADLVCEVVGDALDAYFSRNVDKATEVRRRDDLVDAMNDQIIADLLTDEVLREVLSGAKDIADAVAQILVARYLERIADQAKNICKEVVYLVRGDDVRHKR